MYPVCNVYTVFLQEVNIMLNNLNNTESAEAVEHIEDHTDFGIHESMTDG